MTGRCGQLVARHVDDPDRRWAGQHLARLRHLGQLEAGGRRRQHGQSAALNRLVEMDVTADDPANVGMLAQRTDQLLAVPERHGVNPLEPKQPRVVVHENNRGLVAMLPEIVSEPYQLRGVENATGLTGLHSVVRAEVVTVVVEAVIVRGVGWWGGGAPHT